MCYSAQLIEAWREYERFTGGKISLDLFEDLYGWRTYDSAIKIPKMMDHWFANPKTDSEKRIKGMIDQYNVAKESELQQEVFKQRKRLADAERTLKEKQTKKAINDQRIATNKIDQSVRRINDLKRTTLEPRDSRIFPFNFAPIVIREGGENKVIPARYHCRQEGKPANYDQRFDGLYNARRDNLEKFWKGQFTQHHAVMLISSFYENVALNDFEHRALGPDEKPQNLVLHFNPKPTQTMIVACLWSRWEGKDEHPLNSFAAITDEPPAEIAAAGHDRVVITLKPEYVNDWLSASADTLKFYAMFDDRERPFFEHRKAA
jgi:putative SOS response-associated peptidase YedK